MKNLCHFNCSCTPRGICKRVFEGQEDIYSKAEYLNNLFLFKFPDTLRFTQGRWKFENLGLDPKEDGRLALSYVWFKVIITAYVLIAYIISHIDYGLQKIVPCMEKYSSTNASVTRTTQNENIYDDSVLHSRWPFYWAHYDNWCFSAFTICLIVDTSLVLRRYFIENKQFRNAKELETWRKSVHFGLEKESKDPHWGSKISWILTNVAYPNGIVVGIIFWCLEYPKSHIAGLSLYSALNVHLFQPLLALIDTMVSARPWKIGHFYCSALLVVIYAIFQVLYIVVFNARNEQCQPYLNGYLEWKTDPGYSVGMVAIFLTMVLSSHILFCYLSYVREDWWHKVVKHQEKKVKSELQRKNSQSYINSSYETNDNQSNTS